MGYKFLTCQKPIPWAGLQSLTAASCRRAVPGQLASHIRGRGEIRHGPWIVNAWIVVIICARKEGGLVRGTHLGATHVYLRAGWIELGSTECHG